MLKLFILVVLAVILFSLGSALMAMMRGGDPDKMARALTWRIGLSFGLFLLIILFAKMGWITPHGLNPS